MAEPHQEGQPNGALLRDVNNNDDGSDDGAGFLGESSSDDDTSILLRDVNHEDDGSDDGAGFLEESSFDDDTSMDDDREESVIPTPDEVELEYTYPDDFQDRAWQDVVDFILLSFEHQLRGCARHSCW